MISQETLLHRTISGYEVQAEINQHDLKKYSCISVITVGMFILESFTKMDSGLHRNRVKSIGQSIVLFRIKSDTIMNQVEVIWE